MTAAVTSSGASNPDVEDIALDLVRDRLAGLGRQYTPVDVATAMRAEGLVVSDSAVLDTVESLRRHSVGAGPLEPLLHEPGVTDVLVNGPDQVFIDRGAGLELTGLRFPCEGDVRRLAQRLAASVGRRLDDAMPFVDARLADGSRVHAVLGTLASPGTCISLRVPAHRSFSLEDCVASGSLTPGAAQLLSRMIEAKLAFLISGGTGSGKTTLLAALLALVPPDERIVIVEDSRELAPNHPHVVRIEGRPANTELAGAITLTDLVRQSLRMRPDRLVVGRSTRGGDLRPADGDEYRSRGWLWHSPREFHGRYSGSPGSAGFARRAAADCTARAAGIGAGCGGPRCPRRLWDAPRGRDFDLRTRARKWLSPQRVRCPLPPGRWHRAGSWQSPAGTDARPLIMIMVCLGCAVLAAWLAVPRPAARSLSSRLAPPAADNCRGGPH